MTSESLTGSTLRRAKDSARVLLGRADPFRQRVRPAVACIENNDRDRAIWRAMRRAGYRPYTRIRQDEIYLARGFEPVAPQ